MPNMARYCCCAEEGGCVADPVDSCGNCDDITPNEYDVTFSGITACSACFTVAGTDAKVTFLSSPNATFRLVHKDAALSNTACVWEFQTATDYVQIDSYLSGDGTCNSGGAADVTITDQLLIQLTRNGTDWDLLMTTGSGQLFCDTQSADTDGADQLCATVPSFTNDITSCGGSTCPLLFEDFDQATGGTASVVCVESA